MADHLRALASMNGRFAPALAQTMLVSPRTREDVQAFQDHAQALGLGVVLEGLHVFAGARRDQHGLGQGRGEAAVHGGEGAQMVGHGQS